MTTFDAHDHSASGGRLQRHDADVPAPAAELLVGNEAALHRLEQLRQQALEYAEKSIATSTRRYYETDLKRYEDWCARLGVPSDPILPELVSLHITELADARIMKRKYTDPAKKQYVMVEEQRYKISSLRRFVASLSRAHYERGGGRGLGEHPTIAAVMAGLARTRLEKPAKRKPLMRDDVADLIDAMDHSHWPAGVLAARDTLMVLIGFATALRRENVAGLTAGDVLVHREDGLHITVGKTKTDQEGQGATLAIPFGENTITCVPCAWYRWSSLLAAENTAARMALVLSTPADPALWRHVCRRAFPNSPPIPPSSHESARAAASDSNPSPATPSTGGSNCAPSRPASTQNSSDSTRSGPDSSPKPDAKAPPIERCESRRCTARMRRSTATTGTAPP